MAAEPAAATPATGRLSSFLLYGASHTITEGVVSARGLVLALLLGPQAFGVWSLFRLVCRYGLIANLGIGTGIEIEVVRARTSGKPEAVAEGALWGRAAVSYSWVFFGGLGAAFALSSFWVENPDTALVLRALALGLLLDRLWSYARTYLRLATRLRRLALAELWQAVIQTGGTCLGAWIWGLPGVFLGFVLSGAAAMLLVLRDVPFRPLFSWSRLRRLISVGLPLISVTVLMLGLTTVDRLTIVGIGGTTLLGTYTFAVAIAGFTTAMAGWVRTVVVPEVYAGTRGDSGRNARRHLDETVWPFALLYPLLLGVLAILLGPVIHHFAPEYREGLPVARLFVFTGVTAGLHGLAVLPVVAAGRERAIPAVAGGSLAVNAAFAGIAVASGSGLWVVAAGALVARTLLGVGVLRLATGVAAAPRPWFATLRMLLPLFWCVAAVLAITRFAGGPAPIEALEALGLYGLAIAPWAPAALRAARRVHAAHR